MKHLIQNGGGLALGLERAEGDRAGGFASGLVGDGLAVLLGDGARQAGGAFPGGTAFLCNERNDPERDEASEQRGESPLIQATGLLHDASEAYLGDISGPLKRLPAFDGYREVEEHVERVIAAKYGLPFPYPPIVKVCDNESADLEMYGSADAGPLRERSLADGPTIDEVVAMFLERAAELGVTDS